MSRFANLPEFPWNTLIASKQIAASHPDGIVDLSVGSPVDNTPQMIQDVLASNANAHSYPAVSGSKALLNEIANWLVRSRKAPQLSNEQILPVIGTKEAIAWLPTMCGLGAGDLVVIPECAYPTYEVSALMAGARVIACDDPAKLEQQNLAAKFIWLNSPANPHGEILGKEQLKTWLAYARKVGAIIAGDECYADFVWEGEAPSLLDVAVCGGDTKNILVVMSTSKRSNMAGYRAGFVAGDQQIIKEMLELRKHLGMMVPQPILEAMRVSFGEDQHVVEQKNRYLARRTKLKAGLEKAGYRIDYSAGSLYLWATLGENCRVSVDRLAKLGILVAPGDFYGPKGANHVRVALTATDERIDAAVARLAEAQTG